MQLIDSQRTSCKHSVLTVSQAAAAGKACCQVTCCDSLANQRGLHTNLLHACLSHCLAALILSIPLTRATLATWCGPAHTSPRTRCTTCCRRECRSLSLSTQPESDQLSSLRALVSQLMLIITALIEPPCRSLTWQQGHPGFTVNPVHVQITRLLADLDQHLPRETTSRHCHAVGSAPVTTAWGHLCNSCS